MANNKDNSQNRVALTKGRGGGQGKPTNPIGRAQDVETAHQKFHTLEQAQTRHPGNGEPQSERTTNHGLPYYSETSMISPNLGVEWHLHLYNPTERQRVGTSP